MIKFNNNEPKAKEFSLVLNKKVNDYFKEKGISKKGNSELYFKTFLLISTYVLTFTYLIVAEPQGITAIGVILLMGIANAGIGLNVMHDAIHGSYSNNHTLTKVMQYSANFIGISAVNWRIQHNVKHHTNTNIEDHDEDIAPKAFIRFTPHSKRYSVQKAQFIYAWILYSLGTFFWVLFKDFVKFKKYVDEGLVQKHSNGVIPELLILILTKIYYFSVIIGLPILFTSYSGLEIFLGFLILHLTNGICLAVIFQPSHLLEEVEYPLPDQNGLMPYSWLVHQLYTSVNFATTNPVVSWYAGGLNYQVEHHLFPAISHVHYKHLAKIVQETAKEYGYPYHNRKSFIKTLWAHTMMLKKLGSATPA